MMKTFGLSILAGVGVMISCSHVPLWAQMSLPGEQRTNGKDVEAVFEPQRLVLQKSTAVIYEGSRNFINGVVMSADGWILTKASEIEGKEDLTVRVDDKQWGEVKVMDVNSIWDLALLKIDAEGLVPMKWASSSEIEQGSWVITSSTSSRARRRISIGIISANAREIEGGSPVVMGVALEEVKEGLKIAEVSEKTGAQEAGLKKGDVITKFEGASVVKREELIDKIKLFVPGDKVKLEILRDGKTLDAPSPKHQTPPAPQPPHPSNTRNANKPPSYSHPKPAKPRPHHSSPHADPRTHHDSTTKIHKTSHPPHHPKPPKPPLRRDQEKPAPHPPANPPQPAAAESSIHPPHHAAASPAAHSPDTKYPAHPYLPHNADTPPHSGEYSDCNKDTSFPAHPRHPFPTSQDR